MHVLMQIEDLLGYNEVQFHDFLQFMKFRNYMGLQVHVVWLEYINLDD